MKRILLFLLALLLGGTPHADSRETAFYEVRGVTEKAEPAAASEGGLRAVWLSQFDLQPLFRDGNRQRDELAFDALCRTLCGTLARDGFNTVFLQMRPNGDSMYESRFYPLSKYVCGDYGETIGYDAAGVLIARLRENGISVHGWINPLRLMREDEMENVPERFAIRRWYDAKSGQVKACGDYLYLDPAYPEVRELIADGAREMCERYGLDGIHMDDYFYPTTDPSFDEKEFSHSAFSDLGDFRRDNVSALVSHLYDVAHECGVRYGIAPAGNLDSLADGYFADVFLWLSKPGFVDYILPQLYFGFENKYCPFDVMVSRWADAIRCDGIDLYIGLTAAKAAMNAVDVFAGTDDGKTEWMRCRDVLARSLSCAAGEERVKGVCFFSYSWMYDRFSGEVTEGFREAYEAMKPFLSVTGENDSANGIVCDPIRRRAADFAVLFDEIEGLEHVDHGIGLPGRKPAFFLQISGGKEPVELRQ